MRNIELRTRFIEVGWMIIFAKLSDMGGCDGVKRRRIVRWRNRGSEEFPCGQTSRARLGKQYP